MANTIKIEMPYEIVEEGFVVVECVMDDGITKEEFLAGVKDGSIYPFAFELEEAVWTLLNPGAGVDVTYEQAKEIK